MRRVLKEAQATKESTAIDFYKVAWINGRWLIMRRSNCHIICICRSHLEAVQLAITLNQDCARDPQHHPITA
jgi:hypothetical protein